jgi:hypothetical protein
LHSLRRLDLRLHLVELLLRELLHHQQVLDRLVVLVPFRLVGRDLFPVYFEVLVKCEQKLRLVVLVPVVAYIILIADFFLLCQWLIEHIVKESAAP